MNNKENIKNRFDDFLPDVDQDHIAGSWEKIKYFVPQKEPKRRFGFFFLEGKGVPLFLSAFISALVISGVVIFTNTNPHTTIVASEVYSSEKTTSVIAASPSKIVSSNKSGQNEKFPSHTGNTSTLSKRSEIRGKEKNFTHAPEHRTLEEKKAGVNVAVTENANETFYTPDSHMLTEKYEHLSYLTLKETVDSSLKETSPAPFPKYTRPLSVEVFAGGLHANQFIHFLPQNKSGIKSNGFMAGVAFNYSLVRKADMAFLLSFSRNNLSYEKQITELKITKKSLPGATSSAVPDTTHYVYTNTNYKIETRMNINAGLGLNYHVFMARRISLDGFVFGNVSVVKYNYSLDKSLSPDTLKYISGSPNPPPFYLNSPSFKNEGFNKTETRARLALLPGLTIGYKISSRISIVLKSGYFIRPYEERFKINSALFDLRQSDVMLNAGLRLKL